MTKRMKKGLLGLTAASALTLCAGAALAGGAIYADAEETTTNAKIAVEESASLRIENFGLRFKTAIAADYWQEGMTVHTLMIPEPMLSGDLTAATENVMDVTLDNAKKYQKGTDYYFNTVLTQIPQAKYGTKIAVRAYVEQDGVIEYAENTVSVSVAHVANAALEYSYDTYVEDLAEYLVQGVTVSEKLGFEPGNSANLNAGISYFDEASDTVKGKLNALYTLSYETSDGSVATVSENGEVTAVANGTAEITVKINELNITAVCAVTVSQPEWGEVFDFNNPSLNKLSVHAGSTLNNEVITITADNKVSVTLPTNSPSYSLRLKGADATQYTAFNTLTYTYSAKYESGTAANFLWLVNGAYVGASSTMPANGNSVTVQKKEGDANWNYVVKESELRFVLQSWRADDPLTVTISSVKFGYNDIAADNEENTTFNLTERFGVAASELKNVMFNGKAVADITAFAPTESGALTFTVEKDGFASTDFSVNVTYTALEEYYPVHNFASSDVTKISINSTTQGEKVNGTVSTGTDSIGAYTEFVLTNNSSANIRFFGVDTDALKKFDWFKINFTGYYIDGETEVLTKSIVPWVANNSTTVYSPRDAQLGNKLYLRTSEVNRNSFENFDGLFGNNLFRLIFDNWGGKMTSDSSVYVTMVVRIYSIEFGYNDIESDGTTAIDLTDKFNATADELTATFAPTGGTAAAVTDKAAWIPAESGVLTVTIKRSGYKAVTYTLNVTVTAATEGA